jgi:hypothetical protein
MILPSFEHVRMTRGGHGLPKVSCGPAMPYHTTTCGQAVLGMASPQDGRPAAFFYPLGL